MKFVEIIGMTICACYRVHKHLISDIFILNILQSKEIENATIIITYYEIAKENHLRKVVKSIKWQLQ